MRYQKPFTLVQRHDAVAIYRSFCITFNRMRFDFPPVDRQQRQLMHDYRRAMREFSRTLSKRDVKVDVVLLNAAKDRADAIALKYAALRSSSPRFGDG